jgi:hypothetical protein
VYKRGLMFLSLAAFLISCVPAVSSHPPPRQQTNSQADSSSPDKTKSNKNKSSKEQSCDNHARAAQTAEAPGSARSAPPAATTALVWVNTDTKVFHKPGNKWYGKTKHGKYMTEADARRAGYRPAAKE